MAVRCKFICSSITTAMGSKKNEETGYFEPRPVDTAKFYPVTSGSEENSAFFLHTPSGMLEVGMHLKGVFEPGKEYYVDITLAK